LGVLDAVAQLQADANDEADAIDGLS
jgi:hypothetical protein